VRYEISINKRQFFAEGCVCEKASLVTFVNNVIENKKNYPKN
jgi:hypothetical protein